MLATLAPVLSGVGVAPATNSYFSIATVNVGSGGSSTITFSSIPQTYTHLQLRMIGRTSDAAQSATVIMKFNGDTTVSGHYAVHLIGGNGSSASAYGSSGDVPQAVFPAGNESANVFGAAVWDILDYTNTNKNKVTRNLSGFDNNGDGIIRFSSGLWLNTSAITQIDITPNASSFNQYSTFALYGVK
jgi:hypothetical protein